MSPHFGYRFRRCPRSSMPQCSPMATHLIIFLIGFTLLAALILLVAYLFFLPDMRKSRSSKIACTFLLIVLGAIQWLNYLYFSSGFDALGSPEYSLFLLLSPPAFYLFSRSVIFVDSSINIRDSLHLVWLLLFLFLPTDQLRVAAFVIGSAYTVWFARVIWGLRAQRANFHVEMFFFSLFAVTALFALTLGLALPYIDPVYFYMMYAGSIGIAMMLVVAAIIIFPELLSDILTAGELAYATSKLDDVDVDSSVARLEQLLKEERVYQNENLNLNSLAELVELTPHQLSELINTRFGMGFPRYLRERRITVAKQLLASEHDTSILAISMMAGFKSQSNFYTAFKEATGQAPGKFRSQIMEK